MKILLTGGTGFIGSALFRACQQQHDFVIVTRNPDLQDGRSFIHPDQLLQLETLNDFDAVINLAGEPIVDKRWSEIRKDQLCQSRWRITEQLTTLINQSDSPPEVFISGSAVGIYGRQNEQQITEDFNEYHPEFSHNLCSKWEQLALQAQNSCRVCIIRTGIVLGSGGGALSKMLLPFKLGLGGSIGAGNQYMPWIHLDDQIAAIIFLLLNRNAKGEFNFTAPYAETNINFSRQLAKTLGRPMIFNTPAWVLKLIMGEMADLLLYGQNVYPQRLLDLGFKFKYSTLDLALKDIC